MEVYVDTDITRRVKEFLPELEQPAIENAQTALEELFTEKTPDDMDEYEFETEVICRVYITKKK